MKVHVKLIVLFIVVVLFSCTRHQEKYRDEPNISKVDFMENSVACISGLWNTTDGIRINIEEKVEYFFVNIEVPPSCQRDKAEIQITQQLFQSDSLIYENKVNTDVDTNLYVAYWMNSLNVLKIDNEYGAYFFTSLKNTVGGLDPEILIMWIYYDEKLYKFKGIIPLHQDWSWNDTYSFTPDTNLELKSEIAYRQAISIWEQYIGKYKEYYDNY